jgi:predicted HicB family RNase H-like nuclease
VVSYVASTPQELQAAFVEAVEDYLTTCAELGDEPDAPFKGSFNVRTGPERHRSAVLAAASCETSLNDWVCQAIDEKLEGPANAITNHLTVHVYGTKTSQHVAATGTAHIWANRAVAATATDIIRH